MKWKKWVIDEEKVNYENKAIIGHYNFAKKDFLELKRNRNLNCRKGYRS